MENLIILTTATCRPEMHNMTFNKEALSFLDNIDMPIKWLINIDKTRVCPSDQETTKKNFEHLLKEYDVEYKVTETPNFFIAFKNLILQSEKFLNEKSIILNYEDDWLLNKKFNLQDIIYKYHKNNSYISFVYNLFGTLPPCLIGYNLILEYIKAFKVSTENIKSQDPEKYIRGYLRQLTLKDTPIHYFLINNDIEDLKLLLPKKDKVIGKMKIDNKDFIKNIGNNSFTLNEPRYNKNNKNFLVTDTEKITEDIIKQIKSVSTQEVNIISFKTFREISSQFENENCLVCIKFGGTHTYIGNSGMDYNNTYFRDLGRFIGKSPKLNCG